LFEQKVYKVYLWHKIWLSDFSHHSIAQQWGHASEYV